MTQFRRLRRADPAAAMPRDDEHDRERLRRAIVATPLDPKAATRRRRLLRRPAALIFVGAAVLLLGAGAVYARTLLLAPINPVPNQVVSSAQLRAEYNDWARQITLPSGVRWRGYHSTGIGPKGGGHFAAALESIGDWSVAWLRAAADGDAAGVTRARTWAQRLSATIPTITPADERKAFHSAGGTEGGEVGYGGLDQAIAAARHGHFVLLVDRAAWDANWGFSGVKHEYVRDPGEAHAVTWTWTLDGVTPSDTPVGLQHSPAVSRARARAEGDAVIDKVGQPAGLDLASRLFDGVPPGVDPTPFPPGALAEDGQHDLGDDFEETFSNLWVAWWTEWIAAAAAGDRQGVTAAAAATARLESLLPATLTFDGHTMLIDLAATPTRRDLHDIAAQARAGDLSAMKSWLAFQHAYWSVRLEWRAANIWLDACGDVLCPVSWSALDGSSAVPSAGFAFERTSERRWLACWRAWYAAIAAGDTQKAAAETRVSNTLRERMARGWPADRSAGSPAQVALSPATLRQFDRLAAQARRGDASGLQDWLIYQVLYETAIGKMALTGMTG